jgi:DNA-binding beta-propeller fold protein YncE
MCHSKRLMIITFGLAVVALAGSSRRGDAQGDGFRRVDGWAQVPADFRWGEIADAHAERDGSLWVLHRPPTPGGSAASAGKAGGSFVPILRFDSSLKLVKSFGEGMFLQPHGLHVDPEGNIWVTDSGPFYDAGRTPGRGYQVFKFAPDGTLLMTLGKAGVSAAGPETFVAPTDVVVNSRGEIFIADGHTPRPGPPDGDRIVKLSKDGRFIKAWAGQRGSKPGEVAGPHRLAMDSRGRLFVADRANRRIEIFDQEGGFIDQWTQFGTPSGIWIDPSDVIYVAVAGEKGGIRIGSAKDGSLTGSIGGTSPEVVTVDQRGNVYSGLVGGMNLERYTRR